MINDIHAMYAEKQKKYQDYLVEKRVHEQKLAAAIEALKNDIEEIKKTLVSSSDPMATRIIEVLNKYGESDFKTASSVAMLANEVQAISEELEAQIREALT